MLIVKTFRYRLEATVEQRQQMSRFAGSCRFVYNWGLAARKSAYEAEGKLLSYSDQARELTRLKKDDATAWLREVNAQSLQQALKDLDAAFGHFFRRVRQGADQPGFPKFKRKGQRDSFRCPQAVKVQAGRIWLPKIGWMKYRNHRPLDGKILQATVKREGEHWFVCLACEVAQPERATMPVTEAGTVGIDVGLKNFAFLSDGTSIENPRYLAKVLPKLRRAHKHLSKKTRYSKNWRKQVAKVVRLYIKLKNSRKDFAHKLSTDLVKNHDAIVVEDINIRGLLRNRHLSRAIWDVGWGGFLSMLEYKAKWAGKHFVRIDRFQATTKTCSNCGLKKPMPLSVRTYQCEGCGMVKDRDWNASQNIRTASPAVLGVTPNACGEV